MPLIQIGPTTPTPQRVVQPTTPTEYNPVVVDNRDIPTSSL